ncbi:MAG: DUF6505 family protein [Gammaproteobacteria bacterium]
MKLARTIRLDESDDNVFERPADAGEWAISGAFEFSNWDESNLTGKPRQAFSNGWLSLESFGRATFVAVTSITDSEYQSLTAKLAQHFVDHYGAPDIDAALPVAKDELDHMQSMCEDHDDNTLLMVSRTLNDSGVHESFRFNSPQSASLDAFAVHGSVD